jgi:hypothetical protein
VTARASARRAARLRFRVGDRVTVTCGARATVTSGALVGARGRITQRAHADVRPNLDWVVTFEEPRPEGREWAGFADDELAPWTVHPDHRPGSVGALQHPARRSK